jgi:polyhydroxybutyrate depolymerase
VSARDGAVRAAGLVFGACLLLGLPLASRPASAEATVVERALEVGGEARRYLIHVPAGWDRVRPLPVLFVFHGAGSDAESMVAATGFDALSDEEPGAHMIVVYPRARAGARRYEVDPPSGRASADVLFVDALLARLRSRFAIDPRRVWATGFSNGAALCYRLAAERPTVFSAIAPVAGYLPALVRGDGAVPVPLLHVHGTADERVPPPRPDRPGSAVVAWARWNGAMEREAVRPEAVVGGLVVRRVRFTGRTPRSDAVLLLLEGRGHEWSGGPGGVVTREVLAFLWSHGRV